MGTAGPPTPGQPTHRRPTGPGNERGQRGGRRASRSMIPAAGTTGCPRGALGHPPSPRNRPGARR